MKRFHVQTVVLVWFAWGCTGAPYHEVKVENPAFAPNTAFESFEDLSSPKFAALKEKYDLDTVFHGEQDEFKKMLLLRDWIRKVIRISDFESSYPGAGYAGGILDAALNGQGFHCGHYMIVQNAVMNAYGYVTRCIGAGPGVKGGPDGHHGTNEIWSNKYGKWFVSDAKYNHHFEKDGIPLSALEIRDEYLKNKAADLVLVKGPAEIPIGFDVVVNAAGKMVRTSKEQFAQTYTWIEWEHANNRFTGWPDNGDAVSRVNVFADEYFNTHEWIWDGKPHWAYHTDYMLPVNDRSAIEWTPNTITATTNIEGDRVFVHLGSATPNLKAYQMRDGANQEWRNVPETAELMLRPDGNEISFRAVNLVDVAGSEYKVVISRE